MSIGVPIGAAFRAWAVFVDTNGTPLTSLSPAPVFTLLSPSGVTLVNAQTMTQLGSTKWFYYDVAAGTTTVSGGHPSEGACADSDVANSPVIAITSITEYNLDTIQAHTDLITGGEIQIASPLSPDSLMITIVRGDDYTDLNSRSLVWTNADWTAYSLLTATSITFKARTNQHEPVFTKTMTAPSATSVKLQLLDTETVQFVTGLRVYDYDIELVMGNGQIVTLVQSKMSVVKDVR